MVTQVIQFPVTRTDDPCEQVRIMIAAMGIALQKQNLSEFCKLLRKRNRVLHELHDQGVTIPEDVEINRELIHSEKPVVTESNFGRNTKRTGGPIQEDKIAKNQKENQGGSYRRKLAAKYKKPQTRGDKFFKKGK